LEIRVDSAFGADPERVVLIATLSLSAIASITLLSLPAPLAIVVITIVAALAFVAPAGGLCAVLVSLPWFYHPIAIGSQQFAASELLLFGAGVGIALSTLWRAVASGAALDALKAVCAAVLRSPLFWIAGTLTFVGLVLALRPYDPAHRADSLREWRWTLLEPLFLLGLIILVARSRPHIARFLAVALIAGATLASAQAFIDFATGGGVEVAGVTRIAGPYPHPNALALYTTRIVALALAWLVFEPRARRWLFGPALLAGAATVATFSRGALISLAVAASLLLPTLDRRLRLATVAGGVAVATALIVIERDRMLDLFGGGSGSLRLDIWRSAMQMIRDRPIIGYGPDQFLYAYLPRYIEPTAWNERFTAHAHNLIFDFWIRLGIIGGAFAIVAIVSGAIRAYVVARRASTIDALTAAGTVALVAALAHGWVDNAYFSHDLAMSGWCIAWLTFGSAANRLEGRISSARPRRWRRWFHRLAPVR
jgi:putative inorganic carbon (hco3(-)) transporter